MSTGQLKVHSENILPIIKRWLYSEKDIFIRELISNASDAIRKVKILRDQGEATAKDEEFRIDITTDAERKTLTFSDTGIGMTAEEVEKYIAEVAFSGAEDFIEKYKDGSEKEQIIGHFGLGFYSSYMVAEKVEIQTLSYLENATPALWSCDGSSEYKLGTGTRETRGTDIILHVSEEEKEYLETNKLSEILKRFCSFLPYPIYLNGEKINTHEPLWIRTPSECTDEDYLTFFKHLYPFEPEPLFWVHLNVDYPFNLKGILYFTKTDRSQMQKEESIHLYCNRVFVADNCKDILPEYLTSLKGMIDSPDIPLNVSRSHLQVDRTVRQVSGHISKKVADRLKSLFTTDRQKFETSWPDLEVVVKLGALQDDKFYDRVKDFLIWQNTSGDWTTLKEYSERQTQVKDKIFYTEKGDASQLVKLYEEQGIEVLETQPYIDTHMVHFLEGKMAPTKFQRVDSEVDSALIDKEREKNILDAEGKSEASHIADCATRLLKQENVEIKAESLTDDHLPAIVTLEEQSRRIRDYMRFSEKGLGDVGGKHTLILNTNNTLVQKLQHLEKQDAGFASDLLREVYELSLLSQSELKKEEVQAFVQRTNGLMQRFAEKISQSS